MAGPPEGIRPRVRVEIAVGYLTGAVGRWRRRISRRSIRVTSYPRCDARHILETHMDNLKGPNIKKRPKCKNCKGEGEVKKGDKVVKCQRCKGTGLR
jgi:DnaJ-class molecular chaperone